MMIYYWISNCSINICASDKEEDVIDLDDKIARNDLIALRSYFKENVFIKT